MHRFLRLVTQRENAAILSAELRDMDGKYGSALQDDEDDDPMPVAPCPYGVSLLATAWTTNLPDTTCGANSVTTLPPGLSHYDGVTLRHGVLNANMGCWDGDNNDGISVIDVTDPLHPAYCFIHGRHFSIPLSAYEYLSEYYDLQGTNVWDRICLFLDAILPICGIPLLEAHVLMEAWPCERFESREPEQDRVPVVVPHDHAPSPSDSSYIWTVWETAVTRLMDDPDDEEPRKWLASLESAGLPVTDATWRQLHTYLLRHSWVFDFQFVPTQMSSDILAPLLELLPKIDVSSASDKELAALKSARGDIRANLRQLSPFPEDHLDSLLKLMTISGDHFADLSGYDLSAAQIVRFASRCPDMDSLDISQNPHISLDDIPTIFIAAPHIRRLNVCGCGAIDGQALLNLVRTQPSLFRTAEAIIHPAFLTIVKPPDFPIAFTFMCACEQDVSGVGLPLFTPTQVLQALCQILPPVWHSGESQYTRLGADTASPAFTSTPLQSFLGPDRLFKMNVPGSLLMSASMLTFAVFSSGSRRPGQSWSDRAVIGVPLHPYPSVSARPEGSWAFYFDSSRTNTSGHTTWTFIHYTPDEDSDAEPLHASRAKFRLPGKRNNIGMLPGCPDPRLKRRGKAYDLRGFLRCMADEGRPLPPEELVAQLEVLLYSQHGGQLVCLPTPDADVPTALTVIPPVPLRTRNAWMTDVMTRRMYAMESEVHPFARYWTEGPVA
ncbi:hypothetical protein TRAPUB_3707 [Trametes pubescens]|uniref:Uncharacterized protein n=1 Tax=Trametes pubescens TaxID=154538 RepID=A0A1M2VD69_TRAPU|nr:hypothetical protein TRAPUB_3707 [Trametes pubescens]